MSRRAPGCPGDRAAGDEAEGIPQGLYVTLPAEELTLDGFAGDGRAGTMAPGPLLAVVLGAVAGEGGKGLAGLSDDQPSGFLSGTRRMESQMAWAKMAALAEFASRPRRQDFAADEIASAFQLTWLLIRARNATCTAPGCGRRAASCDLDHTPTTRAAGRASAIWRRRASVNNTHLSLSANVKR
jgi:hypothetical protein